MNLQEVREKAVPLCERYDVRRLDVFGSTARGQSKGDSDLDLLVEFNNPAESASGRFFGLLFDLESSFGCHVDLLTANRLRNPYFQKRVLSEKVTVYEH